MLCARGWLCFGLVVAWSVGEDVLLREESVPSPPTRCVPTIKKTQPPQRVIELKGKFGLLNNRIRCLANAVAFAQRNEAVIALRGPWEMFADAVLDRGALVASGVVQFLDDDHTSLYSLKNESMNVSCGDFFACGGPCQTTSLVRGGGQRARTRDEALYAADSEPQLCGYAFLVPRAEARGLARQALQTAAYDGYHQRLETMVRAEPVAKMCRDCAIRLKKTYPAYDSFYDKVCDGRVRVQDLLATNRRLFVASDRLNKTLFDDFSKNDNVFVSDTADASLKQDDKYLSQAPSAMFRSTLGAALYASRFDGGPQRRREALAREVIPVLVDMLLLAHSHHFYPTPGSTMSQTVCFWRRAFRPSHIPPALGGIRSCEELVVAEKNNNR